MLRIHSTRLFPKDLGADQYRLTGIAARCDWVVLSDKAAPQTHLIKQRSGTAPKTVFLSFRWQRAALRFFVGTVLPQITGPFILISGSEDTTIPNQTDARMAPFDQQDRADVAAILGHPLLTAWVAENLDHASHPKLHPLPLGMVFNEDPHIREMVAIPKPPPLSERPLKALCGHRMRPGAQWEARRKVADLAASEWSDWCTRLEEDVTEHAFIDQIEQHAFVLCVEGGGLDPSPKAWLTLLHGAIPIIKRSALDKAYKHLPVAFVDDWTTDALSRELLKRWHQDFTPLFDQAGLRRAMHKRLGLDFWWDYILEIH
jgi:hypothetical protein